MNNRIIQIILNSRYIIVIQFAIIGSLFTSCSSSDLKVSEFKFQYNNKDYIVRSAYCSGNPRSCNHLIGDDFIAVDMNQDRIIDKIDKGNIALAEAQEIYDYSLNLLAQQNKLNEINRRNDNFILDDRDYHFEIRSFFPDFGDPFNEFTITNKKEGWNVKVSVLLDEKADGKLDELLKGNISIDEAQKHYESVINQGLTNNGLRKSNGSIVVN